MSNLQLQEKEEGHILYTDTKNMQKSLKWFLLQTDVERLMQAHTSDFSTPGEFSGMHPASTARLAEKDKSETNTKGYK